MQRERIEKPVKFFNVLFVPSAVMFNPPNSSLSKTPKDGKKDEPAVKKDVLIAQPTRGPKPKSDVVKDNETLPKEAVSANNAFILKQIYKKLEVIDPCEISNTKVRNDFEVKKTYFSNLVEGNERNITYNNVSEIQNFLMKIQYSLGNKGDN